MKKQFSKILVERPRLGGKATSEPKGYNRDLDRIYKDEDWIEKESMRKKWKKDWSGKELNENLAPLYRFLQSRVGLLWDDVYSEISKNIKLDNPIQKHIIDHLKHMVYQNVVLENGIPYSLQYGKHKIYNGNFWVHPETGILNYIEKRKYVYNVNKTKIINIDENHQAHIVNNIWYSVEVKSFDRDKDIPLRDILLGTFYIFNSSLFYKLENKYGASNIYGVSKKQLNKKEIKKLGLRG